MSVPFLDMHRVLAETRAETTAAIGEVLDGGRLILGDAVARFEEEFASVVGARHAIGVGSGTDAIEVALRALGVGPGDEVVTQANTCPPTAAGIARTGATVVLCDVDPASGRMDPTSAAAAVTERTRAVVPVHLYGQCADVPAIAAALPGHVAIVEDCAQAHLAGFDGHRAGAMGTIAAWSFYPTKNLGALGDAGAVTTADHELARRARAVRQYAAFGTSDGMGAGVNSRLDELQAAVLRTRLARLATWTERRREIAARYHDALADSALRPLALDPRATHAYHLFVVRSDARDRAREKLEEAGVQTLVHYPTPLHRLPALAGVARAVGPLPASERLCAEVLSLPLYPQLTDAEVDAVIQAAASAGG